MPDGPARPPGRRRWLKRLLIAALAGIALVAVANVYVVASTRAATVSSVQAAPVRPYAIVLGNRVFPGGIPSHELAARLKTALELHRARRAEKVVVSGAAGGSYDEPHAMAAWLEARGVPRADIVVDMGGHRTAATMTDAVGLGIHSALIVSQGYHLPRALYLARHAGIDAVGVPAVPDYGWWRAIKVFFRESLARAEVLVEVAFLGVR